MAFTVVACGESAPDNGTETGASERTKSDSIADRTGSSLYAVHNGVMEEKARRAPEVTDDEDLASTAQLLAEKMKLMFVRCDGPSETYVECRGATVDAGSFEWDVSVRDNCWSANRTKPKNDGDLAIMRACFGEEDEAIADEVAEAPAYAQEQKTERPAAVGGETTQLCEDSESGLSVRVQRGEIDCDSAFALWQEYVQRAPSEGSGNGGHLALDGWNCSAARPAEHPRLGACESRTTHFEVDEII